MVLEKCDGICGDVDGEEEMVEADTSQRELWAGLCKHHRSVTGVSYHQLKAVTPCSVPQCFMMHCSNPSASSSPDSGTALAEMLMCHSSNTQVWMHLAQGITCPVHRVLGSC